MIRLATIVGARPQFIKAAALSATLNENYCSEIDEQIIHTGQHFDHNMSQAFFTQLEIPRPRFVLNNRPGSHGVSTGLMMGDLDAVLKELNPDAVLVYGDTNSTLAGALSAVKLHIPVLHVEAGMRSFNWKMPEEVNRVTTDHVSALNFAPSMSALHQLQRENLAPRSVFSGDIMFDAVKRFTPSGISDKTHSLSIPKNFVLATIHRQENTNSRDNLNSIFAELNLLAAQIEVILPIHPRLLASLQAEGLLARVNSKLRVIQPVSFIEMLSLTRAASVVITDSGGLQKEAFYHRVPCLTVRNETEWVETIELGWNRLVNPQAQSLRTEALNSIGRKGLNGFPYGDGKAASRIAETILQGAWRNFF